MFLLAAVFFGLGFGAIQPALQAAANHNIELQRRGAVNGMIMATYDLGIGVSAFALGYLADLAGYAAAFMAASLSPLVLLGLSRRLSKRAEISAE